MRTTIHIVQRMSPGGLEALALQLVLQLPERHLLVSLEGDAGDLASKWSVLEPLGDRLVALGKKPGLDPLLIGRLARFIRERGASSVVTHHVGPFLYGGAAARAMGVKRLVHVEHDAWHYRNSRRRRLSRVLGRALRPDVVAVSQAVCEGLAGVFDPAGVKVISNGVDVSRFATTRSQARDALGLPHDSVVVGSVGRLERVKGHDVLVRAAALCPPHVRFVVVGDGGEREPLEALARACGVHERVHFVGHRDDPARLYAAFDVFCLPSRAEGLPLALLEAQAAGVRVVASQVGDVARGACPATGRSVAPDDPLALSEALRASLEDEGAASPRSFIETHFSWSATLHGYARSLGYGDVC